MPKPSAGRVQDAWAEIDRRLEEDPYLRFSIDTHRNGMDSSKRRWHAVLFREKGNIVSRVYGNSREEALVSLVAMIPREE